MTDSAGEIAQKTKIVQSLCELLQPLTAQDRQQVLKAALTLLGEEVVLTPPSGKSNQHEDDASTAKTSNPRAKVWIKNTGINEEALESVLHFENGTFDVISSPGNNTRDKTQNVYLLTGVGNLILTGEAKVEDQQARKFCETLGCYDRANHAATLKALKSALTGSKDKGWTVTAPGLKRVADLLKSS